MYGLFENTVSAFNFPCVAGLPSYTLKMITVCEGLTQKDIRQLVVFPHNLHKRRCSLICSQSRPYWARKCWVPCMMILNIYWALSVNQALNTLHGIFSYIPHNDSLVHRLLLLFLLYRWGKWGPERLHCMSISHSLWKYLSKNLIWKILTPRRICAFNHSTILPIWFLHSKKATPLLISEYEDSSCAAVSKWDHSEFWGLKVRCGQV